jgi:hypothetical protein
MQVRHCRPGARIGSQRRSTLASSAGWRRLAISTVRRSTDIQQVQLGDLLGSRKRWCRPMSAAVCQGHPADRADRRAHLNWATPRDWGDDQAYRTQSCADAGSPALLAWVEDLAHGPALPGRLRVPARSAGRTYPIDRLAAGFPNLRQPAGTRANSGCCRACAGYALEQNASDTSPVTCPEPAAMLDVRPMSRPLLLAHSQHHTTSQTPLSGCGPIGGARRSRDSGRRGSGSAATRWGPVSTRRPARPRTPANRAEPRAGRPPGPRERPA